MKTTTSAFTHVGQRSYNEDMHSALPAHQLYLVADGMGGHYTGDRASGLANDTIAACFERAAQGTAKQALLVKAIEQANEAILAMAGENKNYRGMGTTVAALTFEGDAAIIAHVGDSRVYLMRDGALAQLTQDHSLLNEYMKTVELTPEQIEAFPHKNIITRALGMKDELEVSVQTLQAQAGDMFLLCSDGLTERLDHARLALLMQHPHDELARSLVMAAVEAGASDNITAIVVCCA